MNEQSLGSGERPFEVPPDLPPEGSPGQEPEGFRVAPYPPSEASSAAVERASGLSDFRIRSVRDEAVEALFAGARTRQLSGQSPPADHLVGVGNVQGLGWGLSEPEDEVVPGTEVLRVYVAEPVSADTARALVVDGLGVRAAADLPLHVVHSGIISMQNLTHRQRPAGGGVSISHHTGVQGTLGFFGRGRNPADAGKIFLVSNNHVIANVNSAAIGSCIVQPSAADGGRCPDDRIAILDKIYRLDPTFTVNNYADCARAWCYPDQVVQSQLQVHMVPGIGPQFYGIGSVAQAATMNMWVGKTGCITQTTYGKVEDTYWGGLINGLPFDGQIAIRNPGYTFSTHGDSGAVVWAYDSTVNPVGLLVGGHPLTQLSFASPISWVLDYLDLNLL
ncbi:hypothetical protein ACFYR1_44835 [Streptomyces canus]|uniref:hypothetical protein n=1 Tax=Streptomyces canus TaxID=58343 RepID=UPI00368E3040